MKDILGREIAVGDIVAHGTRSGNSGDLNIKIIAEKRTTTAPWGYGSIEQAKVINFVYINTKWDKEKQEHVPIKPIMEKGGTGWSNGYNMLVVNESVPANIKKFLKGLI